MSPRASFRRSATRPVWSLASPLRLARLLPVRIRRRPEVVRRNRGPGSCPTCSPNEGGSGLAPEPFGGLAAPQWAPYWAPYPPNPRVPGQVLEWVNLPSDLRVCPWPGMPGQGRICMTRMRSGVRFTVRPPHKSPGKRRSWTSKGQTRVAKSGEGTAEGVAEPAPDSGDLPPQEWPRPSVNCRGPVDTCTGGPT